MGDDNTYVEGVQYYDGLADEWLIPARGVMLDFFDMKVLGDSEDGDPAARLQAIALFLKQDYSDNPVAREMQNILRGILDIDFINHLGTDNRKGAVARVMGLSKGWPGKNSSRDRSIVMANLFKPAHITLQVLDSQLARASDMQLSSDAVRKVRAKRGIRGKPGRKKNK